MLIDEFLILINFNIFALYSYKTFYEICLKLLLYAKFIVICAIDNDFIY